MFCIDYNFNLVICDIDGKNKCLGLLVECVFINSLIYSIDLIYKSWIDFY